jgi:hypothetical protein
MKRRIALATAAAALLTMTSVLPAVAMGSGNPYENVQVGVTYTVYQPTFTAGLNQQFVGANQWCQKGVEQNLLAKFGKRNQRSFSIYEGNPMCSDIGNGQVVLTANVNGSRATVIAYCDPASPTPCKTSDVLKFGGRLNVMLPGVNGLKPTQIWIETYGKKNLSAQQLVQVARGLQPTGAS